MYRSISGWGALFLLLVAVGIFGCSSPATSTSGTASGTSDSSTPAKPEPAAMVGDDRMEQMGDEGHAGHTDDGHHDANAGSDMEKMKAGLAELSEADRTAAQKQHICPVSGKMLGTMGKPIKVSVNDREVWLCCPGCEGQLRKKPEEYLAKLSQ